MRSSFLRLPSDDRRRLNMKGILVLSVFLAFLAVSVCRPQISSKDATIVDQNNNFNGIDPWKWNFRAGDGSEREEEGVVDSGGSLDVGGSYTRVAPNGAVYLVTYRADKHGFHMISKPLAKASKEDATARLHKTQY